MGLLGVMDLVCWGKGLFGGGGLGDGSFDFGGCGFLGKALLGFDFLSLGSAATWAFCAAA
jgi:hypothetical protein